MSLTTVGLVSMSWKSRNALKLETQAVEVEQYYLK